MLLLDIPPSEPSAFSFLPLLLIVLLAIIAAAAVIFIVKRRSR